MLDSMAIKHRLRRSRHLTAIFSGAIVFVIALVLTLSYLTAPKSPNPNSLLVDPDLVNLTLVPNATEKGALCLDGSPPAYHLQRGFGSGVDSWLIHIEGGGWCNTAASCSFRAGTPLGSSRYMGQQVAFAGILSQAPSQNPDFYNWNRVKIRYCDGASLSGDTIIETKNGRKLYFRGQRIWEATIHALLTEGLGKAKQAFLTGCSAGGLATAIHCDSFRALMPKEAIVKCLADAGFFLDEKDISGKRTMQAFYDEVVHLQDVGKNLPHDCTKEMDPSQIKNILVPEESDPQRRWLTCKKNIHTCDSNQIEVLRGYRTSMLNTLKEFQPRKDMGMYVNSCYIHCQTISNLTWHSPSSPRIKNKTIAEAVGDWYFNRREVKDIDCPFPCNPSCYNMDFS